MEAVAAVVAAPKPGYFHAYAVVGLLAVIGVLFVASAFGANQLLRPYAPTQEKLLAYECGVTRWGRAGRRPRSATTSTPSSM